MPCHSIRGRHRPVRCRQRRPRGRSAGKVKLTPYNFLRQQSYNDAYMRAECDSKDFGGR